jgi:ribosomal protein S18 acetylase RimI-like enzyme
MLLTNSLICQRGFSMPSHASSTINSADTKVQRIRTWQLGRAVRQMLRAYPPGTDALVDQLRSAGFLTRFVLQRVVAPLYFAREQGWTARGEHGEMAAILYVRRVERKGIRVMHIDNISVDARYRRRGLAERLMMQAEELARQERRPFLKLAVTATNTPAITLYRRLGYDESGQRHRFFTFALRSFEQRALMGAVDLTLRPLRRRQAAAALQRFYALELAASVPALARMLAVYYPLDVPKGTKRMYAIEQDGRQLGYGDAYRRDGRWNLDVSLRPELWGGKIERQAIQLLTSVIPGEAVSGREEATIALHLPSAAHFDALCAGTPSLASLLDLREQRYDRMIMVKVVASLE